MTGDAKGTYDNPLHADNVYGHALDLLRRHKFESPVEEIHLDIGCGYGRIAERIRSDLGRIYVGIDGSDEGLASLAERGFETHKVWLQGHDETLRQLETVVAGRRVGSITMLDTIEHLVDGDEILRALADVGRKHLAHVVLSTPNIAHRDIGAKLMFGRWNYTDDGLLDHTHVRLFDHSMFSAALGKAGLLVVDRYDVVQAVGEQHFPSTHPALAPGTLLNSLLFDGARRSSPYSSTYQFVWFCAPSREMDRQTFTTIREQPRPLVTAVIRTQGRRLHTMVEVLTCLSGQSDRDFEAVVVGHKLDPTQVKAVERVIDDSPEWLRKKIRFVRVDDGGRSRPLNVGFAEARGSYIAILDDDDIPFGNWVAEYRKLDASHPGQVLRCASVRQDVRNVEVNGRAGLRAEGPPQRIYPSEYNFVDHFVENSSPPITLAFPHGAFHDLGLRFDEDLDTTEDWDFLLRVSAVCGVASSPAITGVYRWWTKDESSRTLHGEDEWRAHHEAILRKQDQTYFILPKGGTAKIRQLAISRQYAPAPPTEAYGAVSIVGMVLDRLHSVEDAEYWGKRISDELPRDLARVIRYGVYYERLRLGVKFLMAMPRKYERQKYSVRIAVYGDFLRALSSRR